METIKDVQSQREKSYGSYYVNADYVGEMVKSYIKHYKMQNNNKEPSKATLGSMCHIFIKMARLLVEEPTEDTLLDLESYVNLHRERIEVTL